jgi:CRP-like cAMP-binding protein
VIGITDYPYAHRENIHIMRVAPVSPTAYSQLLAQARRVQEPKGAVLFRRDEPAFGIFLVQKGRISLRLESDDGKPILNRTLTQDSIVGLPSTLSGGRYSLTAVTLEESELAFVDRQALIELIRGEPSLGLELMRALGDEVLQMRATLASAAAAS